MKYSQTDMHIKVTLSLLVTSYTDMQVEKGYFSRCWN